MLVSGLQTVEIPANGMELQTAQVNISSAL